MASFILNTTKNRIGILTYVIFNFWATRDFKDIPSKAYGNYILCGLPLDKLSELDTLYQSLRRGRRLGFWKKVLLRFRGKVLCATIFSMSGELLGFQLHSFNKAEHKQHVLHIEYSGIIAEERNKGLASALRRHSARHYANLGLRGLTAFTPLIDKLNAAEHVGYQVISKPEGSKGIAKLYFDLAPYID